ncbi:hypothetical protein [Xenorhabdus bovienii]|uniref:hypothetical protein n=1 Tax=Xenorhabdus bovienii TaxID=40576 RepID=UPI0023B28DF5|nr:hypothetical protein [Xenorhabdus bovienii]MDE9553220.1 hypothetical protein [Xenorhabdus bovienii]
MPANSLNDIKEFERIEILEETLNAFYYIERPGYATKFYIYISASDSKSNPIKLGKLELATSIKNKEIRLINFLNNDEYTLGSQSTDSDKNDFFVSNFFMRNDVNIIEVTSGCFYGYAAISVAFKIANDKTVSTAFMSLSGFESHALIARTIK